MNFICGLSNSDQILPLFCNNYNFTALFKQIVLNQKPINLSPFKFYCCAPSAFSRFVFCN
jgi:hypothetical protein